MPYRKECHAKYGARERLLPHFVHCKGHSSSRELPHEQFGQYGPQTQSSGKNMMKTQGQSPHVELVGNELRLRGSEFAFIFTAPDLQILP